MVVAAEGHWHAATRHGLDPSNDMQTPSGHEHAAQTRIAAPGYLQRCREPESSLASLLSSQPWSTAVT